MIKIGRYKNIVSDLSKFKYSIKTFIPTPKEKDYKKGYIIRYFIQKANDSNSTIYEVSKDSYKNFSSNPLFVNTQLDWRISGEDFEIKKSNSESIKLASNKIKKISLYLPNLLQFKKR